MEHSRRILVISQLPPPTHGSTIMTRTLIDAMTTESSRVVVVERDFSRSIDEVGRFTFGKVLRGFRLVRRVQIALRARPDLVIHFATNRLFSLAVDMIISRAVVRRGVPLVAYLHTNGWGELAGVPKRLATLTLKRASKIVCLGPTLEADLASLRLPAPVCSIPNAVLDSARPRGDRSPAMPRVLYLSNLLPDKGVDTAIQIAKQFRLRGKGATFTIAGAEAYDGQLAQLRRDAGDSAEIVGALEHAAALGALAAHDVLLFPSTYRYEAQPLVILEALANSVVPVCFDVGGVRDIVENGVNGLLVDVGDRHALARALASLIEDPEQLARLKLKARASFESKHAVAAYRASWEEVLDDVSGGRDTGT